MCKWNSRNWWYHHHLWIFFGFRERKKEIWSEQRWDKHVHFSIRKQQTNKRHMRLTYVCFGLSIQTKNKDSIKLKWWINITIIKSSNHHFHQFIIHSFVDCYRGIIIIIIVVMVKIMDQKEKNMNFSVFCFLIDNHWFFEYWWFKNVIHMFDMWNAHTHTNTWEILMGRIFEKNHHFHIRQEKFFQKKNENQKIKKRFQFQKKKHSEKINLRI